MKAMLKTTAIAAIAAGTLLSANVYAGAEAKCAACHDFGAKAKVGPGLAGIVGRKAGTAADFKYSDGLKKGGWVWDEDHLRKWLVDSKEAIKEFTGDPNAKTNMPPQKLNEAQVDEVIKYLKGI